MPVLTCNESDEWRRPEPFPQRPVAVDLLDHLSEAVSHTVQWDGHLVLVIPGELRQQLALSLTD